MAISREEFRAKRREYRSYFKSGSLKESNYKLLLKLLRRTDRYLVEKKFSGDIQQSSRYAWKLFNAFLSEKVKELNIDPEQFIYDIGYSKHKVKYALEKFRKNRLSKFAVLNFARVSAALKMSEDELRNKYCEILDGQRKIRQRYRDEIKYYESKGYKYSLTKYVGPLMKKWGVTYRVERLNDGKMSMVNVKLLRRRRKMNEK